jgi:hypothetical protein
MITCQRPLLISDHDVQPRPQSVLRHLDFRDFLLTLLKDTTVNCFPFRAFGYAWKHAADHSRGFGSSNRGRSRRRLS